MTPEQREAKRVYHAAWYQDHREERLAHSAAYYAAHRDEKLAHYEAHKDERRAYRASHREKIRAYQAAYGAAHKEEKAEFGEWLQILRTNNGCEDCETHEGRLYHHHIDPDTKRYNISEMYRFSLDTLGDELEKCVVLCHPCHTKRHVEMRAA